MPRRSHIFPLLLAALLSAFGQSALAQTAAVTDPRFVEFNASPDHNVNLSDGTAMVTRYELQFFQLGAAQPAQAIDLGKPAPDATGLIRLDLTSLLSSWPAAGVVYEARVVAVGPRGVGTSTPSNTFVFSAQCGASLAPVSVSVGPAATTGSVVVSSAAGCAWTAASNAAWISITSGATGTGSGTVAYSVAANTSSSARTATMTIAGQPFTVTQAAGCTFTVSPTASVLGPAAGTGTISVSTGSGCAWTAASSASWITVTSGASGSGSGSVGFSVTANTTTSSRSGTLTIAGRVVTITQEPVACTYTITPLTTTVDASARTGQVTVAAANGCPWTAASGASWITVTSGASGSGNGQVAYSIAANTSTSSRTGTVTIAGQTFSVTQSGIACTYALSPITASVPSGAATGTVGVTAPAACSWTATSSAAWLTVTSGGSGSGSGAVNYAVAANTTINTRSGELSIGGQTFTVSQAGMPCTSSISPTSAAVGAAATQGSLAITMPAQCAWTASSGDSWITIVSASTGFGSATLSYAVAANTGTASRTGTIRVAGQLFDVTQAGVPCSYSVAPLTASAPNGTSTGSVTVTAAAGCAWSAASSAPWISITSGNTGSGTGAVGYSVAANSATMPRSGVMTIAGQAVTVTQAAGCGYGVSPSSASVAATASTGAITVSAGASCPWSATSSAQWVTFTTASGTGPGSAAYSVAANPNSSSRSTTLTVAGQSVVLTQAGASCDYTVSPVSQGVVAAGASASVTVTVAGGCTWTAVPSVSWITVTSGASGTGSGTVAYTVDPNPASTVRSGTIAVAGRLVTVTQGGVACTTTLSSTGQAFDAAGGNDVVSITQPAGCVWTALSNATWIRVTSAASGSGSGAVTYNVLANTASSARTGTMTIAGQAFTVTQSGTCTITISPDSVSTAAAATTGTLTVSAGGACAWTAASNASWLTITSGGSGTGTGTVAYSVAANTTAASRTGTITAGGRIFTVTQAAPSCTYLMQPTSISLSAAATTKTVQVVVGASCAWTASSSASWITVTGGAAATGSGTVTFNVAANTSTTPRTGMLTIAGQTVTVDQAGLTCAFTVAPAAISLSPAAATSSVEVTGPAGCSWTAAANVAWITLTSGGSGDGAGTVAFSVAANTSSFSRSGTLTVGGRIVSVAQAGNSCTIALSSIGVSVGSAVSTASVNVMTGSSCEWVSSSNVAWITVTAGTTGTGNGTVVLSMAENTSTASRTGYVNVAGRTFTVTQAGSCQYSVSPTGAMVGGTASTAYVWVTAGAGCAWTASSADSWVTVNTTSGQGTNLLSYTVSANPATSPRTTMLSVAGQSVAVTQAGAPCSYTVSPINLTATTGGPRTVTVTAPVGCAWVASSGANWITVVTTEGNGPGSVTLQLASNTGATARVGIVTIAGWRVAVYQTVLFPPPPPRNLRVIGNP